MEFWGEAKTDFIRRSYSEAIDESTSKNEVFKLASAFTRSFFHNFLFCKHASSCQQDHTLNSRLKSGFKGGMIFIL